MRWQGSAELSGGIRDHRHQHWPTTVNFQSIFIIRNRIVVYRTKQCVLKIFDIHSRSLTRQNQPSGRPGSSILRYLQVYNALSVQFLTVLEKFSANRPKA